MVHNDYFRVLPKETQQALGKIAFDTFVNHPPAFEFRGRWEDMRIEIRDRWLAIVEAIFNQLQNMDEFVTTELVAHNERQRVLADATERFENWKQDEGFQNNYQLLAHLVSLHGEVVNAQLLVNRNDIELGHFQVSGDENTRKVILPNVWPAE